MCIVKFRLIIFVIIFDVLFAINCNNNETIFLNLNEIVFFKTTNFPDLLDYREYGKCLMNFSLLHTEKNYMLTVAYFDVSIEGLNINYISDDNETYFSFKDYFSSDPIAFQGQIIFEKNIYNCPLESVAKDKPFELTDDTEIFFLYSNYGIISNKTPCYWNFKSPRGYMFKVVFLSFDRTKISRFLVTNSTDIILNDRNVKAYHPLYNEDNELHIELHKNTANFGTDSELEAYISILKTKQQTTNGTCKIIHKDLTTTWQNFDSSHDMTIQGYGKNEHCEFKLIVENNAEVALTVNTISLEKDADYVKYYMSDSDDTDGVLLNPYEKNVFQAFSNHSSRSIKFEYHSDASIQSWGFDLYFEKFICECSNIPIVCDTGKLFTVMKDVKYYCGNLQCSFTIQPCSTQFTLLSLSFLNYRNADDIFKLISDGTVVFDIDKNDIPGELQNVVAVFLNSSKANVFEIITRFSPLSRTFGFKVNSFSITSSQEIFQASISMIHIIDFSAIGSNMVKIIKLIGSSSVTAYTSNPGYIPVFNNESLTLSLNSKKCFGILDPYKCFIEGESFALYNPSEKIQPFIAVHNGYVQDCVLQQKVYNIEHYQEIAIISSLSTYDHACTIVILFNEIDFDQNFYISHLCTTASHENVKIFIGSAQDTLYFEYNSKTAKKWKNIILFSEVYTVIIPKNSAIYMTITGDIVGTKTFDLQYPYQTIIATPYYKTRKGGIESMGITFNLLNCTAKFTIIDYKVWNIYDFSIYSNDMQRQYPDKIASTVTFSNEVVSIEYDTSNTLIDDGVVIFIETVK